MHADDFDGGALVDGPDGPQLLRWVIVRDTGASRALLVVDEDGQQVGVVTAASSGTRWYRRADAARGREDTLLRCLRRLAEAPARVSEFWDVGPRPA